LSLILSRGICKEAAIPVLHPGHRKKTDSDHQEKKWYNIYNLVYICGTLKQGKRIFFKMENSMEKIVMHGRILFLISISIVWSQNYPATIRVPVTLYDFHSNLSNPEFETVPSSSADGIWKGMVSANLDSQKKPVLGANPFFNLSITKWFRPWTAGDLAIPNYGPQPFSIDSAAGSSPKFITVTYDTAFKNVVIQDTLIFTYVSGSAGVYQFDNQTFFPLDGKGFGSELKNHNFSFTMELHWKFTMEPGLSFQFRGDDDFWAFINNKLVVDVGGRHNALSGTVYVDTLGLVNGQTYFLDAFYCERHTNSATISVMSNMFKPRSDSLSVSKSPNLDTVAAGDSIVFSANISEMNGAPCSLCSQNVTWTITPSTDSTHINPATGRQTTVHARTAYQSYTITAQYDNPANTVHLVVRDTLYVKPGAPDHLSIEANADSMVSLRQDAPIRPGAIVFSPEMLIDSVYAVVRDGYGNWVGHAVLATWRSGDTTVMAASPGRAELGEGIITRQTASLDSAIVIASQGSLNDSVCIIISNVNYSRIQLHVISDVARPIDTLRMRIDKDTSLVARGLRTDGSGIWDDLMVSWGSSNGIVFDAPAPVAGNRWTLSPKDTGTGFIHISLYSQSQLLTDTLFAFFSPTIKRIFSAWANDNMVKQAGIDDDDYVLLSFDKPVEPFSVSAGNIDSLFPLTSGHGWLSGAGTIGSANWSSDKTKLLITLATQTALPTIRIGDTISCPSVNSKTVLTGSFSPFVLSEPGTYPGLPARLISVSECRHAVDGLVFTFNSPVITGMRIRVIDLFGRSISFCDLQNLQRRKSDRFMWDYYDHTLKNRMAKGIYCAQVFRKDLLAQNILFLIK
jgi:fibro-slime domain-containing protein